MGIFDRGGPKKGQEKGGQAGEEADYFDSPQETVSLSDAPKAPAQPARAGAGAQAQAQGGAPAQAKPATPAPANNYVEDEPRPHYGIEQAIQLMRALPVDQNVELVVAVIKTTLESLKVKVSDIIEDASRKQKDLEGRVSNLKQQIAEYEKEIAQRKGEIERLEADHAETTNVKGRLELAERAQRGAAPAAAPKAAASGSIATKV